MSSGVFFFSSRRRHTRFDCDWSSDVCSSDLEGFNRAIEAPITELANVQFTKFTPRRDVFPLIDRQLLLRKIPLNVHKPVIESYFRKVGDIEKITLSPNEGFQNGTVTFVHPDAMADFRNLLWAVYINGHTILTTPANFSKTERDHRNAHVAILSSFQTNICALDLAPLLSDIGAKSAFIPRQTYKYLQRPWAFLSFESEEQMNCAIDRTGLAFGHRQLYWSPRDKAENICVHCGNNSHLYKDCPHRPIRRDRKSTRLNSSHSQISYAVFCLKKKKKKKKKDIIYIIL